jgi:hypothetical protein
MLHSTKKSLEENKGVVSEDEEKYNSTWRDYDQKQIRKRSDDTACAIRIGTYCRTIGFNRIFYQRWLTWLWPNRGSVGRVPTKQSRDVHTNFLSRKLAGNRPILQRQYAR